LIPSYMVDVRLHHLDSDARALKNRRKVRFHAGTCEVIGTVILLDTDELAPGASGYAQLRLERPVVVRRGDYFVLRSYSPVRTIGGGQILHPAPKKRKRTAPGTLEALAVLEKGNPVEMVEMYLKEAEFAGIGEKDLSIRTNIPENQLRGLLEGLMSRGVAVQFDREAHRCIHAEVLDELTRQLKDHLGEFHRRQPLRSGMNKEELFARMPVGVDAKLFNDLMHRLVRRGEVVQEKDLVRLSSHHASLAAEQTKVQEKIAMIYREAHLQPPFFREAARSLGVSDGEARQVLNWMLDQGLLVKVKEDMFFSRQALEDLKRRLLEFFEEHAEITPVQFKELTQTTRKYTIPLLEYLDAIRFTIRIGDARRLRQKGSNHGA
ncbi:MAG: SelB C-terminal domain-containing protein, partial [Syntrophobacteria bacterium]